MSEIERLNKVYPLFKFEAKDNGIRCSISEGHTCYVDIKNGRVSHESERDLDHEHSQKSMSKQLSDCCGVEVKYLLFVDESTGYEHKCTTCGKPCKANRQEVDSSALFTPEAGEIKSELKQVIMPFHEEKCPCRNCEIAWGKADIMVLQLIHPLIEQARKEEREKVEAEHKEKLDEAKEADGYYRGFNAGYEEANRQNKSGFKKVKSEGK